MLGSLGLKTKLIVTLSVLIAFLGVSMFIGYRSLKKSNDLMKEIYEESYQASVGMADLHARLNAVRAALITMINEADRKEQEKQHRIINELTREIDASFESLTRKPRPLREISILNEARGVWNAFRDTRDNEIIPALYAGKTEKAKGLACGIQKERYNKIASLTAGLIDRETKEVEDIIENSKREHKAIIIAFSGIGLLSVSAGIIMFLFLIRGIAIPVVTLATTARQIAKGNLEVKVNVRSRDEIGILADAFNSMAESLKKSSEEQKRLYNEEQNRVRQLAVLQEAVAVIASDLALEPMAERLALQAASLVKAELSALVILHSDTGDIQYFKANISPEEFPVKTIPVGRGLLGAILKDGVPLRLSDVTADPRFEGLPSGHPFLRNLIGIPLLLKNKVIGGLVVANKRNGDSFTQEDEDLLLMLALQSATAIENARLHAVTIEMAATDSLTGLANRRIFHEKLSEEFARAERYGCAFSLLLIDIDHFKNINDTYGHIAGDAVLQSLSRILREKIRRVDTAARYGGEEFVILLLEANEPSAKIVAERIRTAIAQSPFLIAGGKEISLTVSIGIATYPECGRVIQDLINSADKALYTAKQTGRNRVCVYQG